MTDLNSFQSINLSQFFDSVKFQSGSGSGYNLIIDFYIVMFYMLMILMKFSFVPQTFFGIFFLGSGFYYEIHWNNYILKIPTKFGVAPQSFCENQNSVQDQDLDFTFHFNTRSTFHT